MRDSAVAHAAPAGPARDVAEAYLSVRSLAKKFGTFTALRDTSLDIWPR